MPDEPPFISPGPGWVSEGKGCWSKVTEDGDTLVVMLSWEGEDEDDDRSAD